MDELMTYERDIILEALRFFKNAKEAEAHSDSEWADVAGYKARIANKALEAINPKHH